MKLASVLSVFLSLAIISQAAPTNYSKRRFGNESSPQAIAVFQEIKSITQGTDKEAEGADLSVEAIKALFADAPACDQQDRADDIIDLGHALGGDKEKQLIDVAKEFRQLERNTLTEGQQSELCTKPPKNIEINGLLQAQDLANPTATTITPNEPDPDDPDQNATVTPNEPDPDDPDQNTTVTPNEPDPDDPDQNTTVTPNEPDPDDPDTVTPNEPDPDDPDQNATVTPNEPDPDDPDQNATVTPNEPDPDDPDQNATVTPNEPDPDDPDQSATATPNETDSDDSAQNDTATPNEPDPDDPDTGKDDTGKVLPQDPDEDSESNNDGSSTKSNVPQGFA